MRRDEDTVRKLGDARDDQESEEAVDELDASWCRALVVVNESGPRGRELLRGRCCRRHCRLIKDRRMGRLRIESWSVVVVVVRAGSGSVEVGSGQGRYVILGIVRDFSLKSTSSASVVPTLESKDEANGGMKERVEVEDKCALDDDGRRRTGWVCDHVPWTVNSNRRGAQ